MQTQIRHYSKKQRNKLLFLKQILEQKFIFISHKKLFEPRMNIIHT